jgi:hypothetical protein
MPRLEPAGPGLAVSPDHAWLAVAHEGKLSVIDTATREKRGEIDLPFYGQTDLVLSRERLFALVRLESSTACLVFTLPALDPVTSMELIGLVQPMAAVHERLLVIGMHGELPRIVALAAKQLTAETIGLREPVIFAAEAPEDRLLVGSKDLLECWDPLRRRALFRLHLPIARPKLGGFSSRRRQLWIVSESAAGPLEVFRFSDGRLQARAELGKRVIAVDGHPESPRLVVAARDDSQPTELVQFDLALGERYPVPLEGVAASFCVVDGAKPVLVVGRGDGSIDYLSLPRPTPLDEGPPRPEPTRTNPAAPNQSPGSAPSSAAAALSDRLAGWRNRLANEKPGEMEAARNRLAEQSRRRAEAREEPKPTREPTREPIREIRPQPEPRPEPPQPELEAPPRESPQPSVTWGTGWRDALCAWAMAALDAPSHAAAPPPLDEESTLGRAVSRLSLTASAARGLSLIYGQWLLGEGDHGVALLTLAQVIGAGEEETATGGDGAGWSEALGRGTLGEARLVEIRDGRVRLRPFAAEFLDGRASRLRVDPPAEAATPAALTQSHRVSGGHAAEAGADLAARLGRAVAPIAGGRRERVEPLLAEARLLDALPLVQGAGDAESWADLAASQLVLIADDDELPPSLAALPLVEG